MKHVTGWNILLHFTNTNDETKTHILGSELFILLHAAIFGNCNREK